MHAFRKLFAASAAAIVAMASGVLVAHADSAPSVYTTPGGQISQGRLWNTTCEKYSPTIVRCRAEIYATTVAYVNGRYVKRTGWTFNNLSYLPSPRASWANNNLGRTNPNWTQSGRQWKTECDTAATGQGGCRSYIWVKTVQAVKSGSGYTYVNKFAWVFNNVVLFSTPSIPPVTKVPKWIIDQSRLDFTGLGPLQVGTPMKSLRTLGYLYYPDQCQSYGESKALTNRGIDLRDLNTPLVVDVNVNTKGVMTVDGAQVGMTLAELQGIYGAKLMLGKKYDQSGGGMVHVALVKNGGNELVFSFGIMDGVKLKDSDVIAKMVARKTSPNFSYDGC
ncbi:hypothetical protein [Tessaracoccus antarcticus]|uniref:Uncharacterized protein n=1 Tax=Tessaracoccus antarcticus TaxID=2479848 RepID=A0A3M0GAR4_9ACTN|nr:hypothetical protein [Tessaracoccus antarcticus]RMB62004.1 hypothetical protein EAX62_05300 [Tessaracoccus antarcticus]